MTMKDLAARLGVSQTTVSHVLSGRHREFRISAKTVSRVQRLAEKLGYHSNARAQALRTGRSSALGLVVEDLTNPFWTGIASGAERVAEENGYMLVVSNTGYDLERERRALALLREGRVDGLLVPPFARSGGDLLALAREGFPFIQIDRSVPRLAVPCVRTDHEAGARLAVEHLARRGHRRIALLVGPTDIQPYQHRLRGFRAAVTRLRLDPPIVVRVDDPTPEAAQAAMAGYLRTRTFASALHTASIALTLGSLRAIREAGLEIPRDLDVVGFDEIALADLLRYPITTVVQDVVRIGEQAVKFLMDVRAGRPTVGEVLIPPRLAIA